MCKCLGLLQVGCSVQYHYYVNGFFPNSSLRGALPYPLNLPPFLRLKETRIRQVLAACQSPGVPLVPVVALVGAATSIIFVTTKPLSWQTHVCCDKACYLSQQTYTCHDKSKIMFVVTKYFCCYKTFHDKYLLRWTTKVLLRQAYFCHVKTQVCQDKSKLVAIKVLSWQIYVCRDK